MDNLYKLEFKDIIIRLKNVEAAPSYKFISDKNLLLINIVKFLIFNLKSYPK